MAKLKCKMQRSKHSEDRADKTERGGEREKKTQPELKGVGRKATWATPVEAPQLSR